MYSQHIWVAGRKLLLESSDVCVGVDAWNKLTPSYLPPVSFHSLNCFSPRTHVQSLVASIVNFFLTSKK